MKECCDQKFQNFAPECFSRCRVLENESEFTKFLLSELEMLLLQSFFSPNKSRLRDQDSPNIQFNENNLAETTSIKGIFIIFVFYVINFMVCNGIVTLFNLQKHCKCQTVNRTIVDLITVLYLLPAKQTLDTRSSQIQAQLTSF